MADSTAKARYRLTTNVGDIDGVADDFELEAGIEKAEVIGHVNSAGLTNKPNPDQASTNVVELEVSAEDASVEDAVAAIVAAATSVGGVAIVTTAGSSAGPDGFIVTADAPTIVADDDTPAQVEDAATETVVLTTVEFVSTAGEDGVLSVVSYGGAEGFTTITDNTDGTFDVDFDASDGDVGVYVLTFRVTDALGQTADEVVTLTVTAA